MVDLGSKVAVEVDIAGSSDIVGITLLCVGYTMSYELLLSVIAGKISLNGVPMGVIKSCFTTLTV